MSDFFQHGLISTLHRLNQSSQPADLNLDGTGLGLLLPCHTREIGTKALANMVKTFNEISFFDHVIISMNGANSGDDVLRFWSGLRIPHTILWNDSPAFASWLKGHDLPTASGKGLNLWTGLGFAVTQTQLQALIIHDCDIRNYKAQLPADLAIPVAKLGYRFCKGFYSRVRQQLYGRATRLFVIPLVRALARTLGHLPLLDFIDSFRYPLAGECAISMAIAGDLPVQNGWGVEVGWLCEVHRLIDPQEICQVDLAMRYDHKHQTVDPKRPNEGLLGMVSDLALSFLTYLEKEGCRLDPLALDSIITGYRQTATDVVRRYRDVALFNRLPFDEAEENNTASLFQERLLYTAQQFSNGARVRSLPQWSLLAKTDFPAEVILG